MPVIFSETSEAFVPQMANMQLVNGVSFTKGCYTGQEVVARAHYRGAVKRRMRRFSAEADAPPGAGDALVAEGRIDAVVDYDLKPYDYLPVAAVVEAAGGIMTDWDGKPLDFDSDGRVITAATPELHAELLDLVRG